MHRIGVGLGENFEILKNDVFPILYFTMFELYNVIINVPMP